MTTNRIVRLATRGSSLALWQAERVAALLVESQPGVAVELVVVSTSPDRMPEIPLAKLGGDKGLFVKEVEQAVLDGRADAAVHSLKDVPVDVETPGLALAAYPERAAVEDVLISRGGLALHQLPPGAQVATGSARRRAQLLALRPDVRAVDVRGNVQTRLMKLDSENFDALVMARAGLERLGLGSRITQVFSLEEMLPAAGQGIIVVQTRAEEAGSALWRGINNAEVEIQALAERQFVRGIGADCHSAAGCFCEITGDVATLHCFDTDADGAILRNSVGTSREHAVVAAGELARSYGRG